MVKTKRLPGKHRVSLRWFAGAMVFLAASLGRGQDLTSSEQTGPLPTVVSAPSVETWVNEWRKKGSLRPVSILGTTIIVRGVDDQGNLNLEFGKAGESEGTFSVVTDENFKFIKAMNPPERIKDTPRPCCDQQHWDRASQLTGADTILYAKSQNEIQILRPRQGKWELLDTLKEDLSGTGDELIQKVRSKLGYDGSVIEVRGDILLIGAVNSSKLHKGIQALTLTGTDDMVLLKAVKKEGSGLIEMVGDPMGSLAQFKVLVKGERAILPGTKVIFETKKNP